MANPFDFVNQPLSSGPGSWQNYDVGASEAASTAMSTDFENNPLGAVARMGRRYVEDNAYLFGKTPDMVSAEAAREEVKSRNLDLTIPDEGISRYELDTMQYLKQRELNQQFISSRTKSFSANAAALAGSFAAGAVDPINIASSFIPIVPELKAAQWLGAAGTNMFERAAVRAGIGAAEGAVGAAMIEPLNYISAQEEQRTYTAADSFTNILFGGILGAGLHTIGGGVYDWRMGRALTSLDRGLNALDTREALASASDQSQLDTLRAYTEALENDDIPPPADEILAKGIKPEVMDEVRRGVDESQSVAPVPEPTRVETGEPLPRGLTELIPEAEQDRSAEAFNRQFSDKDQTDIEGFGPTQIRPPKEDIFEVGAAQWPGDITHKAKMVPIDELSGGVSRDPRETARVEDLKAMIKGPAGYIERLIVDADGNVIEGQHRLEALRQLGVKEVPVIEIKPVSKGLPTTDMADAIRSTGPIRSEHVQQIIDMVARAIDDVGSVDEVRAQYEAPKGFGRQWGAALDAVEAREKFQADAEPVQTDTPEFKRWFGDSKVVDADGNPLVVYHGGTFDELKDGVFKNGRSFGFFFTPDRKKAQSYAPGVGKYVPVTEAYLSLQNPFMPTNDAHVRAPWVKQWINFWRENGGWVDRRTGEKMEDYEVFQMIEDTRLYEYEENGMNISERWDDFLRTAQEHHDGFFGYDPTDGAVIAVAFESTQIKSAIGNIGTFDPKNPDIRYQSDIVDEDAAAQQAAQSAYNQQRGEGYDKSYQSPYGARAKTGELSDRRGIRGSESVLPSSGARGDATPLIDAPTTAKVPGVGTVDVGPFPTARRIAREYVESTGRAYRPIDTYRKVDPERAKRIAQAFEEMRHDPEDPEVKAAYTAMIKETMDQWDAIKKSGLKVEFIDISKGDPYAASPRLAIQDVKENNHLWVFSTDDGFGTDGITAHDASDNPLFAIVPGETISGKPVRANDIFRIVHDYFGHIKDGSGFRADGEENAWRSHLTMYSHEAGRAMTTETRGQNSWLNYGPHGDTNRNAKLEDTVFAEQKIGLLPDWVMREGLADDPETIRRATVHSIPEITQDAIDIAREYSGQPDKFQSEIDDFDRKSSASTPAFKKWFKGSKVVDGDGNPVVVFHGTTADFEKFERGNANPESDWGAGFYFSDTVDDVDFNYAGVGPDLSGKIEREAERIAAETDREYDDFDVKMEAKRKFVQHDGATLPVYLKIKEPFEVGGEKETWLDYSENYDEAADEYGEPTGALADVVQSMRSVARDFDDIDVDKIISHILEAAGGDGLKASTFEQSLRNFEPFSYITDQNGNLAGHEFLRRSLEDAGFDGIIDHTVDEKFGSSRRFGQKMAGVNPDTTHYIVFKPDQVKGIFNNKPTNDPRFMFQADLGGSMLGFYSQVQRTLEGADMRKASGTEWLGWLKNRPGVKGEELEYTGLADFLTEHGDDPLTREEVLQHAKDRAVQLEQVTYGYDTKDTIRPDEQSYLKFKSEWDAINKRISDLEVERTNERYGGDSVKADALDREQTLAQQQRELIHNKMVEDTISRTGVDVQRPKFERYTLPGGENYKELLLKIPTFNETLTHLPKASEIEARKVHYEPSDTYHWETFDKRTGDLISRHPINITEDEAVQQALGDLRKRASNQPDKDFSSLHFSQKNIIAHARISDRVTTSGKKALHMEEAQSDWHQKGRKKGYKDDASEKKFRELDAAAQQAKLDIEKEQYRILHSLGFDGYLQLIKNGTKEDAAKYSRLKAEDERHLAAVKKHDDLIAQRNKANPVEKVPDAPFKKSWHELMLKRLIRYAAENGYDEIVWTPGHIQAERFDLSHEVDELVWFPGKDGSKGDIQGIKDKREVFYQDNVEASKLDDIIGKDVADRLINNPSEKTPGKNGFNHTLRGDGLKAGGAGMKGFYDKIIPEFLNKYGKKYGAKVGTDDIAIGNPENADNDFAIRDNLVYEGNGMVHEFDTNAEARAFVDAKVSAKETLHSFPITPELKAAVMEGQPLFQKDAGAPVTHVETTKLNTEELQRSERLREEIHNLVQKMTGERYDTQFYSKMKAYKDGRRLKVTGGIDFLRKIITFTMESADLKGTAKHEVIHALRDADLLSDGEWATLVQAAVDGRWLDKKYGTDHTIRERYKNLSLEQQIEEAIAEQFGMGHVEMFKGYPEPVRKIMMRIKEFFDGVGEIVRKIFGQYSTATDIMRQIERGEVGQRGLDLPEPEAREGGLSALQGEEAPEKPNIGIDRWAADDAAISAQATQDQQNAKEETIADIEAQTALLGAHLQSMRERGLLSEADEETLRLGDEEAEVMEHEAAAYEAAGICEGEGE